MRLIPYSTILLITSGSRSESDISQSGSKNRVEFGKGHLAALTCKLANDDNMARTWELAYAYSDMMIARVFIQLIRDYNIKTTTMKAKVIREREGYKKVSVCDDRRYSSIMIMYNQTPTKTLDRGYTRPCLNGRNVYSPRPQEPVSLERSPIYRR